MVLATILVELNSNGLQLEARISEADGDVGLGGQLAVLVRLGSGRHFQRQRARQNLYFTESSPPKST